MKFKLSSEPKFCAFLAVSLICSASIVHARVDLSILQQQGYGVVELKRPDPNTLTVNAKINAHPALLVVDTGWSGHGITLDSESAGSLGTSLKADASQTQGLSGKKLTGYRKGVVDVVTLGNVEMHQVPVAAVNIGALHDAAVRRRLGANGFLSAGFLGTCSAVIDLHNLRLYLRPPGTGHRAVLGAALHGAGLAEIPFSLTSSALPIVNAEVNGATGAMVVDTGKSLTGVDARLATKMNVAGYSSRVGTIDAAGAVMRTELARINSFKIGGVSLRAPDVRLEQFPIYTQSKGKLIGFLGIDILGPNGTIIDFGNLKLYCYPL
jgi:predicted aspartyl protease